MQFNAILKAIHDAWTFAWPPFIMCIIAFLIANFLNHARTLSFLMRLKDRAIRLGQKSNELRTILEPLGLTKLVPIVSFVIVLCFLYMLGGPITAAVSHLPPHLSYCPDQLIIHGAPEYEKLLLFRKYPTARTFNEAYYLALEDMKPNSKDASYRKNRAETYYKYHNFLKFALAFAVIMLTINIKKRDHFFKQLFKFIIILLVISVIWAANLTVLLYQQEQQFRDDWRTTQLSLQTDASKVLNSPMTDEEKNRMTGDSSRRWWKVYLLDTSRIDWIKRTFLSDYH